MKPPPNKFHATAALNEVLVAIKINSYVSVIVNTTGRSFIKLHMYF